MHTLQRHVLDLVSNGHMSATQYKKINNNTFMACQVICSNSPTVETVDFTLA